MGVQAHYVRGDKAVVSTYISEFEAERDALVAAFQSVNDKMMSGKTGFYVGDGTPAQAVPTGASGTLSSADIYPDAATGAIHKSSSMPGPLAKIDGAVLAPLVDFTAPPGTMLVSGAANTGGVTYHYRVFSTL